MTALYCGSSADDTEADEDSAAEGGDEAEADEVETVSPHPVAGTSYETDGASRSSFVDSAATRPVADMPSCPVAGTSAASSDSAGTSSRPVAVDDTDEEESPPRPGNHSSHPVDLTDTCGCQSDGCDEESVPIAGGCARLLGCATDPPHPLKPSVDAVLWNALTRVEVSCLIF